MIGRHLLLDLWLEDTTLLEAVEPLWSRLCEAAEAAGAQVLHAHVHQFEPRGMSGFLLLAEHRAHVLPYLPFLLLAACPLMHVFMHRGHGHRGHAGGPHDRTDREPGDRVHEHRKKQS